MSDRHDMVSLVTDTVPDSAFLLDWQSAEIAAVEHMKTIGFIDAQLTKSGADGGLDAESSDAAAQVKFYANPVGRPDVQRLRGAAHEYRLALFYSTGGYTSEAVAYADQASVALFVMDAYGKATPASSFAVLLGQDEHIQERKDRLEALKVARYGYAAAALRRDLELYSRFANLTPMSQEEAALFSFAVLALDEIAKGFADAVLSKDLQRADGFFDQAKRRISFLAWITGSELKAEYKDIEEAVTQGWQWDATPGTPHLLERAASAAFELRKLVSEALAPWSEFFPDGYNIHNLTDDELRKSAGMLIEVSWDASLLSPPLAAQLRTSVRDKVRRQYDIAAEIIDSVIGRATGLGFPKPRDLVSTQIRLESLTSRIYRQIDASSL